MCSSTRLSARCPSCRTASVGFGTRLSGARLCYSVFCIVTILCLLKSIVARFGRRELSRRQRRRYHEDHILYTIYFPLLSCGMTFFLCRLCVLSILQLGDHYARSIRHCRPRVAWSCAQERNSNVTASVSSYKISLL